MRHEFLFGELAKKSSKEEIKLRHVITQMLHEAKSKKHPEVITERYWEDDFIKPTTGQLLILQKHRCRLYFRNSGGWYYYLVDEQTLEISKEYKWNDSTR